MTVVLKTFPRNKADHKITKTRKLQRRTNCCSHLYSPTQFPICPSPVHPGLHAHVKVPIPSVHEPAGDGSQVSSAVPHSIMSVRTNLSKRCRCCVSKVEARTLQNYNAIDKRRGPAVSGNLGSRPSVLIRSYDFFHPSKTFSFRFEKSFSAVENLIFKPRIGFRQMVTSRSNSHRKRHFVCTDLILHQI